MRPPDEFVYSPMSQRMEAAEEAVAKEVVEAGVGSGAVAAVAVRPVCSLMCPLMMGARMMSFCWRRVGVPLHCR